MNLWAPFWIVILRGETKRQIRDEKEVDKMATMKDVARLAGVSHGTVSNIINGAKGVSLEKVRRVEKAMKELNYEPNAMARSLKMNKSMQIDVILPNIVATSLSQIYNSLSTFAMEAGYVANLRLTNEDAVFETSLLNQAQMYNHDGVILMTCQPQNVELFEKLQAGGLKIIFIERDLREAEFEFVGIDVQEEIQSCVLQLMDLGHQNIGIIVGPLEYSFDEQFFDGYVEAYRARGRQVEDCYCAMSSYDRESALKEAIRILTVHKPPSAMITTCTQSMEAALKAFEVLDISKDRQPLLLAPVPSSWTTIKQEGVLKLELPYSTMAEKAFAALLDKMNGAKNKEEIKKHMIQTKPIILDRLTGQKVCSIKSTQQQKTLRILMTVDKARYAIETLVGKFENETGYRVEIEAKPYPKMYRAVKEQWYRDEFDVFDLDIPWVGELLQKGVIDPLDDQFSEDPHYFDDVPNDILEGYCMRDGKLCGIPFTFCTQLLFYRKDYFDDITIKRMFYEMYKRELEPPKTWLEYNEVAQFFTRRFNAASPTEYGTTLGSRISSGGTCEYLPRLWSFGGEIYQGDEFTLNSEQAVQALLSYKESFQYASKGSVDNWWTEQASEFRDGKAAMMMMFSDNMTAVTERDKSRIIGKIGYDFVPDKVNVDGGWILSLNSHSKNKKEALEFMKWAGSKELSVISTILGGFVPRRTAIENLEVANIYPWLRKTVEAKKYGKLRELPRRTDGSYLSESLFEDILGEMVYLTVTDQIAAKNALNIANNKLNRLLREEF